jgi:hypothetical protein
MTNNPTPPKAKSKPLPPNYTSSLSSLVWAHPSSSTRTSETTQKTKINADIIKMTSNPPLKTKPKTHHQSSFWARPPSSTPTPETAQENTQINADYIKTRQI